MWFKNLQIYRLPERWAMSAEALSDKLAKFPFQPCSSLEMQSRGWMAPQGDESLVYSLNQQWLIALGSEQKLLPASVVNQVAAERVDDIEAKEGYRPGRKQVREIKERVIEELLPRAFARRRVTWVWIDPAGGWLCIDASNQSKADDVVEMLTKSLTDFPLTRLHTEIPAVRAMSDWLAAGDAPSGFSIDRDCELKSPVEEQATVRYVRHNLEGDEIRNHLADGKQPTRLAMTWNDRISFVLTDKLEVKRLAFLDLLREDVEQQAENGDELFQIGFIVMTGELARLLSDLVDALGGEAARQ